MSAKMAAQYAAEIQVIKKGNEALRNLNREQADKIHRLENLADMAQKERDSLRNDLTKVKECRDFLKETIKSFNKVFKNSPAK